MIDLLLNTATGVRDVQADPCRVYVATESGIDIFDPDRLVNRAYAYIESGVNCLSIYEDQCDPNYVLLGTESSGVCEMIYIDTLSGNILPSISGKYQVPTISSNKILCIDRNEDGYVVVGTDSGVTVVGVSGFISSHDLYTDVTACRISSSGDCYYSPDGAGIYVKYGVISSGWSSPDYYLDSTSLPALPGNSINQIILGQPTSSGYSVCLATNSGLVIYQEDRNNINNSTLQTFTTELESSTFNVSDVETISGFNLTSGYLLFSTFEPSQFGTVSEFNIATAAVINKYTQVDFVSTGSGIQTISGAQKIAEQ